MKVHIKELNSCVMRKQKIRQYERFIVENGHEILPLADEADVVLVWTCAFRNDFREASLDEVDYLRKDSSKTVLVGGCLPDIDPKAIEDRPDCISVPWREDAKVLQGFFGEELKLSQCIETFSEKQLCQDAVEHRKKNPKDDVTFHDQFIKIVISEGCNYNCSYCSEKLAFPAFKSMPLEHLVRECEKQIKKTGVTDVMLMADSLGQYGMDIDLTFPDLVDALKLISPKVQFAFNNLNPIDVLRFQDWFRSMISEDRILHLNLPIQSASNEILRDMERPYTSQDLEKIFTLLREENFVDFDTHLIVGFPGETMDDVRASIDFCLRNQVRYVLLSLYMESSGAPSAKLLPKVSIDEARKRIEWASEKLRQNNIICNSDGSEISKERIKRLFKEKRYNAAR